MEHRRVEEYLSSIDSPAPVVQGEDNEYGTVKQVDSILAQVEGPAKSLLLPRCRHSSHSDQPDAVLDAAGQFIRETLGPGR